MLDIVKAVFGGLMLFTGRGQDWLFALGMGLLVGLKFTILLPERLTTLDDSCRGSSRGCNWHSTFPGVARKQLHCDRLSFRWVFALRIRQHR